MVYNCIDKKCMNKLNVTFENMDISQPYLISVLAAIVAAVGLTTNNEGIIIAAMILSPIGSILIKGVLSSFLKGTPFGGGVVDGTWWVWELAIIVFISILIGFIWGLFFTFIASSIIYKREYPTTEMKSRAEIDNAVFMIPIALIGGLVLPSAIHHNNIMRVVGISIAVALLPPLVNIGISLSTYFNEDIYDPIFIKNALITGATIFFINIILIWLPSKLWFKYLCVKQTTKCNNKSTHYNNFFKSVMNVFYNK